MKLKNNIFTALLLTIGLIFHYLSPGLFAGMKFDFLLAFMFVAILINPSFQNIILAGLLGGILSAITTSFPGGQIANILDKFLTSLILYFLIRVLYRENMNLLLVGIIGALGTLISGSIFLTSALILVGLPVPLSFLITTVVLPTSLINGLATSIIYRLVNISLRASGVRLT